MNLRSEFPAVPLHHLARATALALGLLAVAVAVAADDAALPPSQNQGAVTYITGGVGGAEADAMKAAAPRYSLALSFATQLRGRDVYLATVPVVIRNASGNTLLDVVTEGPYLLVNLAAGRYEVSASHRGRQKTMKVQIRADRHERVSFVWTGEDEAEPQDRGDSAADLRQHLPPVKTAGSIAYLSGGIGSSEAQAIKAESARHALALSFSSHSPPRNEYLASVPVVIRDAAGVSLLDIVTEGPYLLLDLPPGSYGITATHRGQEKQATVRVIAGQHVAHAFVWTMEPAAAAPIPH